VVQKKTAQSLMHRHFATVCIFLLDHSVLTESIAHSVQRSQFSQECSEINW